MRPVVGEGSDAPDDSQTFRRVCPAIRSQAPSPSGEVRRDDIFGEYVGAWVGWAADPEVRHSGASGGAITALSTFEATRTGGKVRAVRADPENARRAIPVTIHSSREVLETAGSRYAPVAALDGLVEETEVVVGKPCEAVALRALTNLRRSGQQPLIISFFCAGTPSSHATDKAIASLGMDPERTAHLRYRGNGWPGNFSVTDVEGNLQEMSYEESWGRILGRDLQWRCKLCPDGTGESADVAVGDYWETDTRGFPLFADSNGRSVIIARTERGRRLVEDAARARAIELTPVDLGNLRSIQPLQVERRITLAGRLLGARLAGRKIPRYTGYNLVRHAIKDPVRAARYCWGTFRRARREMK